MGVLVSHFGFKLHFPNDKLYRTFFHVFISHLYIFFGKVSIQIFCLFFFYCLSYFWVVRVFLYVVDTSPLLVLWFVNIFLLVCGLFSHFLISVFWSTHVFNFDNVQSIIFYLSFFFLLWIILLVSYLRNLIQGYKAVLLFVLKLLNFIPL